MADSPVHVVGAAILEGGRCLAARRSATTSMPLKWEFPGGKVEPGEAPEEALVREIREELGVEIVVGELLGRGRGGSRGRAVVLDVYVATLASGRPSFAEHADHGWFAADELDGLDWPEADRPVLAALKARLAQGGALPQPGRPCYAAHGLGTPRREEPR